ncbi:bacillolysin [Bacillus cereus]|nr:bacillolysin [Bacillus cereus]PER21758.1 bacillolysin [Bacillus cereus]
MIYRELARAFGIFDLLFPLLAEAIHTQELDRKEVKVEIIA